VFFSPRQLGSSYKKIITHKDDGDVFAWKEDGREVLPSQKLQTKMCVINLTTKRTKVLLNPRAQPKGDAFSDSTTMMCPDHCFLNTHDTHQCHFGHHDVLEGEICWCHVAVNQFTNEM